MLFPVGEIGNFVENEHKRTAALAGGFAHPFDEFFKRKAGVERLIQGEVTKLSWPVAAALQQAGDPLVEKDRLSDASRSHEKDCTPNAGFLGKPGKVREASAPLHGGIVRPDGTVCCASHPD